MYIPSYRVQSLLIATRKTESSENLAFLASHKTCRTLVTSGDWDTIEAQFHLEFPCWINTDIPFNDYFFFNLKKRRSKKLWLVNQPPLTYPPPPREIRPYDKGLWKPIGWIDLQKMGRNFSNLHAMMPWSSSSQFLNILDLQPWRDQQSHCGQPWPGLFLQKRKLGDPKSLKWLKWKIEKCVPKSKKLVFKF